MPELEQQDTTQNDAQVDNDQAQQIDDSAQNVADDTADDQQEVNDTDNDDSDISADADANTGDDKSKDTKIENDQQQQSAAKTEEQKQHDDAQAKARIQERKAILSLGQEHIQQAKDAVAEAERLVETATDETQKDIAELKLRDAKRDAREAERDARDFVNAVQTSHERMALQYARATETLDIFNEKKNPDTAADALELALETLAPLLETQVVTDENGNKSEIILGPKPGVDIYKHFEREAQRIEKIQGKARRQGQIDSAQQDAAVDNVSGGTRITTTDNRSDDDLSPEEYAKKYKLKTIRA